MMKSFSGWLDHVSTGWVTLLASAVLIAFCVTVLPTQNAAGSPDTRLFYTPDDLIRMAEAYGPSGREVYVRARWTFDLAFPVVYGLFLVTSISWTAKRLVGPGARWRQANLIPLAAVALDYLENTATSLVIGRYPASTVLCAELAPWLTLGKWLLVFASCAILAVMTGAVGWRSIASRPRRT